MTLTAQTQDRDGATEVSSNAQGMPASGRDAPFRALRNSSPHLAAGISMSLMMGHPGFDNRTFGGMARMIAGHVNRGHYFIVFRDGQPKGLVGWAFTTRTAATAWRDGDGSLIGDGRDGDSVIFNVWVTDGPDMNSFLVRTMREEFREKRLLVARRIYADGRQKPITISNKRL